MPKTKIIKKSNLDKFYTKQQVASLCYEIAMPYIAGSVVVEPSAGSGAFSSLFECVAYDIDPEMESIIKADFLKLNLPEAPNGLAFIGNPPFGNRGDLITKFLNHIFSFDSSRVIAFILPATFNKRTKQKIFPDDWKLKKVINLPPNSFVFEGKDYHVPCVFQVWEKTNEGYDLREIDYGTSCQDFSLDKSGDFFMFGASPAHIIHSADVTQNNRGYFLKTNLDISVVEHKLKSVDWKSVANSSVSGGVAWFTKSEIIKVYTDKFGGLQ